MASCCWVLIVTAKFGAIASIELHSGLYAFGALVLLFMADYQPGCASDSVILTSPDREGQQMSLLGRGGA